MSYLRLKMIVLVTLVSAHFICFACTFILTAMGGFSFDEMTTTIGLMLPLFAGYLTAIVKDTVAEATTQVDKATMPTISTAYSFLMIAFLSAFCSVLIVILFLKAFNILFQSFEQFKVTLGLSETAFGVYLGQLTPVLFTHGGKPRSSKRKGGP